MFVFQCFVASNLSCCYNSVLYGSALSAVPAIFFIMIVSAFMNNHATLEIDHFTLEIIYVKILRNRKTE